MIGRSSYINLISKENDDYEVYVADISEEDLEIARSKYGYKTIHLNENGKLPFEDKYFDVVFCNSVIEHVTLDKKDIYFIVDKKEFYENSIKHQKSFAEEIRRISRQYHVQTPNKYFLLESHSWFLNIYPFMSRKNQIKLIKFLNKFWPKRTSPDWNLFTKKMMKECFSDAEIIPERSLGFIKSWIAVKSSKM
ncbi:MAG TPA: class I SAM-dependent methyltransferase [Chitinophagaceae bacterium]|nr:class I SAM-dependent methyltransferase [Chitinophagaceae bacterium]